MTRRVSTLCCLTALVGCGFMRFPAHAQESTTISVPSSPDSFSADEGCRWSMDLPELARLRHNSHYLAGPAPGQPWPEWLRDMRDYRDTMRDGLHDPSKKVIDASFDGVRVYVRTNSEWAWRADLQPGEQATFCGQVRWREGGNRLCAALDWCDRSRGAGGAWKGWSEVIASTTYPKDGGWHDFRISLEVPDFDMESAWAKPILGMDGTFDSTKARYQLRHLSLQVPGNEGRAERWKELQASGGPERHSYDDSIYRRSDLAWMSENFVCGFVFIYDRAFWDPEESEYRVESLCDEAGREFGGYDSVVLWQAYPRIGADDRNQFDFFRHMPGGLAGVRDAIERFQRRGVRVFLPYNPWDTGTRREDKPDDVVLAELVAEVNADGIFLDTLTAAPTTLRVSVDALRPGVAFEPEIHPVIQELEHCSGSWAQWLQEYPEIGVLHLKWIEPRHMQHQIRRWDHSHQHELAAAWLNGSGVFVWENVFGSWNPWNEQDRATLRRMAPVLRRFASHFREGEWLPYFPTLVDKVHSSCWSRDGVRLWTVVNQGDPVSSQPVLEIENDGHLFFDLWHGRQVTPQRNGDRIQLAIPVEDFGAILAVPADRSVEFADLVERQQAESDRQPRPDIPASAAAKSVVMPVDPPQCPAVDQQAKNNMLRTSGGDLTFQVEHVRRECGCFPDTEMSPELSWQRFLSGSPHSGTIKHHVARTLPDYWIDSRPVTNGEFAAFLNASGYRPQCPDRFLHHWHGPACPEALKDAPVVYVDLEDARAYAAWANKRLPTEWQWQRATEVHGEEFQHDVVREWTESQRDDGHNRFVMLRGGCSYQAVGSIWYFPGGPQPLASHAKFLLMAPGLDRCATIGFRCMSPEE